MSHIRFRISLTIIFFLAIISFPMINGQTGLIKDIKSTENREIAAKPDIETCPISDYPGEYEKYYNDHFSIRSILVKSFNVFELNILKKTPLPDKVVIGKDGWLFSSGDEEDSHRGLNPLTETELKAFKAELEYRQNYLKKRNCKFYYIIAPAKSNIYPDKIPHDEYFEGASSWGEQLIAYLNENSSVKPINVFDVFKSLEKRDSLYYKIDDHWNQVGGFYATQEILKRIHQDFPQVYADSISSYQFKDIPLQKKGDLAKMMAFAGHFTDYDHPFLPKSGFKSRNTPLRGYPGIPDFTDDYEIDKEIRGSQAPRILVISDSFGHKIFPFLSEHFSRSVKIFDAWQYKLNEDIVNAEKPDIVLLISWEANIKDILLHQSRLGQK